MLIDHGRAERHQIWRAGGPNSARWSIPPTLASGEVE
jgi:hypothetical protein